MKSKGNLEFDFVFPNSSEVMIRSIVKNKQGYTGTTKFTLISAFFITNLTIL